MPGMSPHGRDHARTRRILARTHSCIAPLLCRAERPTPTRRVGAHGHGVGGSRHSQSTPTAATARARRTETSGVVFRCRRKRAFRAAADVRPRATTTIPVSAMSRMRGRVHARSRTPEQRALGWVAMTARGRNVRSANYRITVSRQVCTVRMLWFASRDATLHPVLGAPQN